MNGYTYVDSTQVDNDTPYTLATGETDWGFAEGRAPNVTPTAGGNYTVYPLDTAFGERKGKITIYAKSIDEFDKVGVLSELSSLLFGQHKIHRGSRYLDVYLFGGREVDNESRAASTMVGMTAEFTAPDPFWKLNQPLSGIYEPVNAGEEWNLYDDRSIPAIVPVYEFTTASFTFNNWGNAFCYGAGTITGGPASTTVYLKGPGATRVAVALDGTGAGTFTEAQALKLNKGNNTVRVENAAGALITPGGSFSISFGDTYMRFY